MKAVNMFVIFVFVLNFCHCDRGEQHIRCSSEVGNIYHYFHFFFNCFVPLVVYQEKNPKVLLILCGSRVGGLFSVLKDIIPSLKEIDECPQKVLQMPEFDGNLGRNIIRITASDRNLIIDKLNRLSNKNASFAHTIQILLIGRASTQVNSHQRLLSSSFSQKSGSERRYINNFNDLETALRTRSQGVVTTYLEQTPVVEQFQMFQNARIIIAQHGASLSNIFFAGVNTMGIIEISPYTTENRIGQFTHAFPDCFQVLAHHLHLQYKRIHQIGEFSNVNVTAVINATRGMLLKGHG